MEKIGDVIKKYRISNNFTQFKFAEKIGINLLYCTYKSSLNTFSQ